jgi:hypothetical protein
VGYAHDITLEHRFAKTIKSILGNYFIGQDPVHDKKQATDFEIFTVQPFTVGVRLRRYEYLRRYGNEFTIRWSRPSGVLTEIDKIRAGLVDYILYGFVDEDERRIVQYFIGDFSVFRAQEPEPIAIFPNNPPDSELAVYKLGQFPKAFVVKWWQCEPVRAIREPSPAYVVS